MVRGRADQSHSGRRPPRGRNRLVDFVARQLATFARLCPLSHLDLDLIGIGQVIGGDAKTSRGNLFDRRPSQVSRIVLCKAAIVLASLAGVTFTADSIHGDRQSLVSFGRDRTETHRTGAESFNDLLGRFDLLNRNRCSWPELEQPAQVTFASRLFVDRGGKTLVRGPVTGLGSLLNVGDIDRGPSMFFSPVPPVNGSSCFQLD